MCLALAIGCEVRRLGTPVIARQVRSRAAAAALAEVFPELVAHSEQNGTNVMRIIFFDVLKTVQSVIQWCTSVKVWI
jgi:hypothetical protein